MSRQRRVIDLPRARGNEMRLLDEGLEEIADTVAERKGKLAMVVTHYVYVGKDTDGGKFDVKVGVMQRMDPDLTEEFAWVLLRRMAAALKHSAPQIDAAADRAGTALGEQTITIPMDEIHKAH